MMQKVERILKFIENELSPEERLDFEAELKNSSLLRKEFEDYIKVHRKILSLKDVKLKSAYLESIIPEFRNNLTQPKSSTLNRKVGYAFGVILAFITSMLIFTNIFNNNNVNSLNVFAESLTQEQKIELLQNLNEDTQEFELTSESLADVDLSNLLHSEININYDIVEDYDINYTELVDELNQVEAEKIYKEILNKNFSEKVNL